MIKEQINNINTVLDGKCRLIAVSKTKPGALIMEAYEAGQRMFGENKVQELCAKYEELPKDIEWHMIGHLQSNKVKYIAPFVHMIHGVDSLKLAQEISRQAVKNKRNINCLLQLYIADEETKFGISEAELTELLAKNEIQNLPGITWCGLMGMATFTEDRAKIRNEFKNLKQIYSRLRSAYFTNAEGFTEISMGMSGDWQIALDEGSTLVRIGSAIFGER